VNPPTIAAFKRRLARAFTALAESGDEDNQAKRRVQNLADKQRLACRQVVAEHPGINRAERREYEALCRHKLSKTKALRRDQLKPRYEAWVDAQDNTTRDATPTTVQVEHGDGT